MIGWVLEFPNDVTEFLLYEKHSGSCWELAGSVYEMAYRREGRRSLEFRYFKSKVCLSKKLLC